MKYKITSCDATMSTPPEIGFDHYEITATDGEWTEFDWWYEIESTPENLAKDVFDWIEAHGRIIEVFSVMDKNGKVVLTEEDEQYVNLFK